MVSNEASCDACAEVDDILEIIRKIISLFF